MPELFRHTHFDRWLDGLRDKQAVTRIIARLRRVELGHLGDIRNVGHGILEMRIYHRPGYRIYFVRQGKDLFLLTGGVKDSQMRDIRRARELLREGN